VPKVNKPPTWSVLFRDIERRLRQLERAPRLTSASIRGGLLRVLTPNGREMLRVGQYPAFGDTEAVVFRESGELAFAVYNGGQGAGSPQFWSLWDRASNIVASDDAVSGQGLARPYLPIRFASLDMSNASGTTSGTFTDLEQALAFKQHPKVNVTAPVIGDAGTAGEFRLWDATHSVQLGSTFTLSAGAFTYASWTGIAVNGAHLSTVDLRLQGRRTAGTGFVRARTVLAAGVQS
jgi:hypothetical protein